MPFEFLKRYENQGFFEFKSTDKLRKHLKSVPSECGIYYYTGVRGETKDILYVGKSGTLKPEGFSSQKLDKRMCNRQRKMSKENFMKQIMSNYDYLLVNWVVTMDNKHNDLPAFVEARMLQKYYIKNGKLPKWNHYF